ncbi:MAG: class I adenylate-forming enzyme family protein [bacterium]
MKCEACDVKKDCNIVDVIRGEVASFMTKAALVDGDIELSYDQLFRAVDQVEQALAGRGIRPLDRVAFLCEDCADYVVGSLALLQRGAVIVPVSPSLMGDEVKTVLDRMDVNFLMVESSVDPGAGGEQLEPCGFVTRTFSLRRCSARNEFPAEYAAMNPAFIRFSSGTTGDSKGVLLSHQTLLERTEAANQGLGITSRDTVIWVLSMSFHFVVTILLYLRRAATVVICRQPFPESFLEAARNRHGTVFYAAPFHFHVLATSPLVSSECLALTRLAVSTAMKLSDETASAFREKFGFALTEAYGIIEVGLPFINAGVGAIPGAVGRAQPGYEVRIVDPDADGVGRVLIRGPGLFDAYVSPWKSRKEALEEGWFNTGDVGRLDGQGCLTLLGREKNVINFVGMKIFPHEVEVVVALHPAVQECRVTGVPHPLFGQMPVVEVVLKPDAGKPDASEIRRFCFERLPAHKVPKEIRFVAALKRTASGKIRRY